MLPSSHCSPISTTRLPQRAAQSVSVIMFAPGGQQPSPLAGTVIAVWVHAALHVPPLTSASVVQAMLSLHVAIVGQSPAPVVIAVSHVSGGVTTPSPQPSGQSESVALVAPAGQQPSPAIGVVMGVCAHAAVQAVPVMLSAVHATLS